MRQPLIIQPQSSALSKVFSDWATQYASGPSLEERQYREALARKTELETARLQQQQGALREVPDAIRSLSKIYTSSGVAPEEFVGPAPEGGLTMETPEQRSMRGTATMADILARLSDDPAKGVVEGARIGSAYGAPDDTRRSMILGGHNVSPDFAPTGAEGDRIMARNTGLETQRDLAKIDRKAVVDPDTATPRNYVTPDNKQGYTLDNLTDAVSGAPIPQGSQLFTGQVTGENAGSMKLPAGVVKETIDRFDAANITKGLTKRMREVMKPQNVGLVGDVRGLVQGVAGQVDAAVQALRAGDNFANAVKNNPALVATLGRGDTEFNYGQWFDPSLPKQRYLESEMAFRMALQRSPDGRVSNADMKQAVADLNARGWLSSTASMSAVLDEIDAQADETIKQQRDRIPKLPGEAPADIKPGVPVSAEESSRRINQARNALAKGAPRAAVIKQLKDLGVEPPPDL